MKAVYGSQWLSEAAYAINREIPSISGADPHLDCTALLAIMWARWNEVFRQKLGQSDRSIISELRDTRNKWAHQENFSSDDTYRALDSIERLLTAVSAPEAAEIQRRSRRCCACASTSRPATAPSRVRKADRRETSGQFSALARGGDTASRRRLRALPAGGVRGRSGPGLPRRGRPNTAGRAIFRRTYHGRVASPADRRPAAAGRVAGGDPVVSCRPTSAAARPTRCWPCTTCSPACPARCPGSSRFGGAERDAAGSGQSRGAGRHGTVAGHPRPKRTARNPYAVGRAGLAVTRRQGVTPWWPKPTGSGISPGSDVLCELFCQAEPLPGPDRRVGRVLRQLYGVDGLAAGSFDANLTFAQALTEAARRFPARWWSPACRSPTSRSAARAVSRHWRG